jgi:hypothetical protein
MRDLRFILFLSVFSILLLAAAALLFYPVSADTSSIPTNAVQAPAGQNSSIQVQQGAPDAPEIVYWNETVDLTLVEGWYGIVERYPGGELIDVSEFSHRILISPSVFPLGTYYQWSPDGITNTQGNNIAFQVEQGPRPTSQTYIQNQTSGNQEVGTQVQFENLPLPPEHVADYLVCHGNSLNITFNSTSAQVWLFANGPAGLQWMYPRWGNQSVNFSVDDINSLTPGNYTVLIQQLNQNNVADVMYANVSKYRTGLAGNDDVIYSPFGGQNTTVSGWIPSMILNEIVRRINVGMWVNQSGHSYNIFDDTYTEQNLDVENPYSEITMIDEYDRAADINNVSVVHVAGYTNFANDTSLKIVLDDDNQNNETIAFATQVALSVGNEIGDRRQFSVLFPVYYAQLAGQGKEHSFSVIGPDGSVDSSSFHVYDMPAGQVVPQQTHRYIGGNEFVPTPTPEQIIHNVSQIVLVPTIVYQTVVQRVEVLPWWATWPWWAVWISLVVIVIYLIWRFKK